MSQRPREVERRAAANASTDFVPARTLRSGHTLIKAVGHLVPGKPQKTRVALHRYKGEERVKISLEAEELDELVEYIREVLRLGEVDTGRYLLLPLGEDDEHVVLPRDRASVIRALVRSLSSAELRDHLIDEVELDRALVEALTARSRRREIGLAIEMLVQLLNAETHREEGLSAVVHEQRLGVRNDVPAG